MSNFLSNLRGLLHLLLRGRQYRQVLALFDPVVVQSEYLKLRKSLPKTLPLVSACSVFDVTSRWRLIIAVFFDSITSGEKVHSDE